MVYISWVPGYLSRGVERRFEGRGEGTKVVVLEGARAVGKTRLMRHLVAEGNLRTYTDLSDPTTRTAAAADLDGWLRSLPTPAVIDEAQILSELPLAVKRVVDERDQRLQFVLTGSSSIGRSGLAGRDPLAGRVERMTLRTLTEAERRGLGREQPSAVETLFDAAPRVGETGPIDEAGLLERMERGGLPEFALAAGGDASRRAARIRDDVLDALGRELEPDERFDAARVRQTLDAVVRAPGRILNNVNLGQGLALDRRTVDRYLAILERRFLLTRLPNLALTPTTQSASRAKAHAFDTAVAAESLRRAGVDLRADRERFGQLLESWVVQQLLSAATWSAFSVEPFYWRQSARPGAEVDLVLVDDRGRTVGVEVKAAHSLRPADTAGLRALRDARGLHRGYVIYLGNSVVPLGDGLWALPVNMLDSAEGFDMPASATPPPSPTVRPDSSDVDARLFFSYAHADDEYLGGAMLRFAEALQNSYRFQFGREIEVFTDRTGLAWGTAWQRQLDNAVKDTQFLLAMVTPTYLRSDACRHEFEQFLAASSSARDELVLALLWTPLPPSRGNDPVRAHVDAHQWADAANLAALEPGTPPYRAAVESIARELHATVRRREEGAVADRPPNGSDEADLLDEMHRLESIRPRFEASTEQFGVAMSAIGATFEQAGDLGSGDTYASAAALQRLGAALAGPVQRLEAATAAITRDWTEVDEVFTRLLDITPYIADDAAKADLAATLVGLRVSLDLPGLNEFESMAQMLGVISRHLRPAGRALQDSLRTLRTMQTSVDNWRSRL